MLALAGSLTACGFTKEIDPIASAATKTANAGGMKASMAIEITDGSTQKQYSITANGSFDQDEGELTMDLSNALGSGGSGSRLKLITLHEAGDPVLYVDYPPLSSRLPGDAEWVRLDLEKAGAAFGANINELLGQANQTPAQVLDLLRANGTIDTTTTETLDGVQTTKYSGAIDLEKAAKLHGISAELVQRLTALGAPRTLPVEVWVGDDGLVRQLRLTESVSTLAGSGSVVVTLHMSDFGTDVTVTAPPASDVFDATPFAQLAAGLHGTSHP